MPIVIGAKPESDFTDPVGLLTDCHRRIERFLGVLVKVAAEARGGTLTEVQRGAFKNALRYFREAAPKHTADEERSLFPRLRHVAEEAMARVDALEADHVRADAAHVEVDRLGQAWLETDSLPGADAERLSTLLAELSDLYRAHITVEEREVFPLASRVLSQSDRHAVGTEMAARRGLLTSLK